MNQRDSSLPWRAETRHNRQRERRMAGREILRKMVEAEVADRPLSWWRRRRLVQFAVHLGLDGYEAGLLIRAAEVGPGVDMAQIARRRDGQASMPHEAVKTSWTVLSLMTPLLVLAIAYVLLSRLMAQ